MAGGEGARVEFGEGLPGLQGTVGNIHLFQLSRTSYEGGGRQLAGGSRQPEESEEELDADEKDTGT